MCAGTWSCESDGSCSRIVTIVERRKMAVGAPGKNAANWREKSGYNIAFLRCSHRRLLRVAGPHPLPPGCQRRHPARSRRRSAPMPPSARSNPRQSPCTACCLVACCLLLCCFVACYLVACRLSPASCIPCPASYLLSPAFCLLSPVSCLLSPVSCVLCPVSCVLPPASCVLCPVSCVLSPASCVLCTVSGLLSPVSCLLSADVGGSNGINGCGRVEFHHDARITHGCTSSS